MGNENTIMKRPKNLDAIKPVNSEFLKIYWTDSEESLVSEASSSSEDENKKSTTNQLKFMKNTKFNRLGKGDKLEKVEVESATNVFAASARQRTNNDRLQSAFRQNYVPRGRGNPLLDLDHANPEDIYQRNSSDSRSLRTPSSFNMTSSIS